MSELRADTITASDGTSPVTLTKQSAAKVHAHYNQNTTTVNTSFNVASIVDNASGDSQCNYTASLDAVNYCLQVSGKTDDNNSNSTGNRLWVLPYESTASNGSAFCTDTGGTNRDPNILCYTTHGDLA
jgi:hypothetical protein